MQWFEINIKGLANIIKREGLPAIGRELVQNAFDVPGATEVRVKVERADRTTVIECVDNGGGFEKLADAWTLFNPSIKAGDAELRGRFNVGEKFSIAQASEATIETRKGTIQFHADGERKDAVRQEVRRNARSSHNREIDREGSGRIRSRRSGTFKRRADRAYFVNDVSVPAWTTIGSSRAISADGNRRRGRRIATSLPEGRGPRPRHAGRSIVDPVRDGNPDLYDRGSD